jgi:hypothetical protein
MPEANVERGIFLKQACGFVAAGSLSAVGLNASAGAATAKGAGSSHRFRIDHHHISPPSYETT